MGSTKISSETASTTTPTPTAEETELNKLLLERTKATQGGMIQAQQGGLNLINQLLAGQQPSGDLYQQISGISPEAISQQAYSLAQRSLPQFQGAGILDSGIMGKQISRSIANELLYPAEQFNIGAKQNLLNLALSGQASVQAPIQNNVNNLSSALAGLRSVSTTGTQSQNTGYSFFTNPFVSSLGQGLGYGAGTMLFGGKK